MDNLNLFKDIVCKKIFIKWSRDINFSKVEELQESSEPRVQCTTKNFYERAFSQNLQNNGESGIHLKKF